MSEIRRVLKPGKSFYNVVYTKEWFGDSSFTEKGFNKYEPAELTDFGKKTGFEKVKSKGGGFGLERSDKLDA